MIANTNIRYLSVALTFWACFIGSLSAEIEIYFSPRGGFAAKNHERMIELKNGEKVPATVNNSLADLLDRVEAGSQVKIAMYSFSYRPTQDMLIEMARNRDIQIKLIVDASAAWTKEIRADYNQRILAELAAARKEGRKFDFQLKEIYARAFEDRGRLKTLEDGTVIYGTMHEKFGIIIPKGETFPLHSFCGSANISWGASQAFAENRLIFRNEPALGRVLAEEFARLWNEYGTPVTDNCQSEKYLPVNHPDEIQIISNSKLLDEVRYQRIDNALMGLMDRVDPENGTLDVAMFSFTHVGLANKIISLAGRYPKIKVRILMDLTQIEDDDYQRGVLGPYLERSAYFKELKNIEIRYKWRSNAFGWDEKENAPRLITFRNLLLHHKAMMVNGRLMGIGSYNWSASAEARNFENIMVLNGAVPEHREVVARFMEEFDFIWNRMKAEGPTTAKAVDPQVITGLRGRALKRQILDAFRDPDSRYIMDIVDTHPYGCPKKVLSAVTGLSPEQLQEKLQKLEEVTLLFHTVVEEDEIYHLAD